MGNDLLRTLRHNKLLTQAELAELVRAQVAEATGKGCDVDANWISRLERGMISWPNRDYRRALRSVLDVETDAEMGLHPKSSRSALHRVDSSRSSLPGPIVPRQLPALPDSFTGRASELANLTNGLNSQTGTVVIAALAGPGGIGKTWLALRWALQHLDRFPDGQLFVDLLGFSPVGEPMEPTAALRAFLEALGVSTTQIPSDLHTQTALYRSLIAGKRMLILLDNAAESAQVLPLLPGPSSCTVIVTSRNHLTGLLTRHSAHHIRVGTLSETDAHQLLATRVGVERTRAQLDAATELLASCNGFPLALSIVASRVHGVADQPLAELAADLRNAATRRDVLDDDDPAASFSAVLSWSFRVLTSEQARLFGLLGIAPGPDISHRATAALLGLPLSRTTALVRNLHQASLIDQDVSCRYRMHDLIRQYARDHTNQHLTKTDQDEALSRVTDFYWRTALVADHLLDPERELIRLDSEDPGYHPYSLPNRGAAIAWFTAERPCLLAALHNAAANRRHQVVWNLSWALTTYQDRQGHLNGLVSTWQAGLAAAEHLPNPRYRTRAHQVLGHAYASLRQHEKASHHLDLALTLAHHHDDAIGKAHVHQAWAWAWERRGENQLGLDHATRALHLFRTLGNPAWEADALNATGWCAALLGDYQTARRHCQAALALHRDQSPAGAANTFDSLGFIEHHTGNHNQAIDYYHSALTLYRDLGAVFEVADTLDRMGHSLIALGQVEQACTAWEETLELYLQQGRHDDVLRVQQQLDSTRAS